MEQGGEREKERAEMRYTEKDRDIQKKRDTYTVKEIEIGAEGDDRG